jgi:eukaryotic-like serine/threonine-protein kinase
MAGLAPGTVVDSRYKIVSRLGSGGMAEVYLAEDEQLGRKVALKLLYQRFAEDPGFVERFRREAQAAAGLQHPNVVSVYDRGSYDGTYYIAMEYLPGRSLKQLIRAEAPLDPVRAIDITLQILKAARFAHRRGVIHRDLKPHNVIVDESDNAKVTDFGIARAGASDMTETGSIMGTAQYLSPEQAQGHAVSAGSDLYSIGVVLYEMLTGRVPFDAESAVSIALKHVSEAPPPTTVFNPAVPSELDQVVMWALNKNPVDRPANADQFITALEHARTAIQSGERGQRTASMAALAGVAAGQYAATAAAGSGVAAAARPTGTDGYYGDATGPVPPPDDEQPHRRRLWPWIVALLVLLLAGGGVTAYLLLRPEKVVVPAVVGEDLNTARTQLQNAGFTVGPPIQVTSQQKAGVVISQDPQGATKAKDGSSVSLTVSSGPGSVAVPTVVGETEAQARSSIEIANLTVGKVVHEANTQFASGRVIDTSPSAGTSVTVGSAVTLIVSSGPPSVQVPDVTSEDAGQAKATLQSRGFNVTTTSQVSSTATPNTVLTQDPVGGKSAPSGSTVALVVAKAPPTVAVPNVVGKTTGAANAALGAAGFPATQQQQTVTDKTQNNIVLSQNPAPSAQEKKGTTVTIVVGHYVAPTTPTTTTTTTTPTTSTTNTTGATTTPKKKKT